MLALRGEDNSLSEPWASAAVKRAVPGAEALAGNAIHGRYRRKVQEVASSSQ